MSTLAHLSGCRLLIHALDHVPPHFHAVGSQGDEACISLPGLEVLRGHLRPPVLLEVLDWAERHLGELSQAWREAQR